MKIEDCKPGGIYACEVAHMQCTLRYLGNEQWDFEGKLLDVGPVNVREEVCEPPALMCAKPERLATGDELAAALAMYSPDEDNGIAIDDDAQVSTSEDGTWVQAWVWLPKGGE